MKELKLVATYRIEHIRAVQFGLEIGRTGKNETGNVRLIVGNEHLNGSFRHFTDIIVTLFHTETSETQCRLTTTTCRRDEVRSVSE